MQASYKQEYQNSEEQKIKSKLGFITLSPKKNSKLKSQINSQQQQMQEYYRSHISQMISQPDEARQKENYDDNNIMTVWQERPFKKIPNYSKQELKIKYPNDSQNLQDSRERHKKKLSVTKMFDQINQSAKSRRPMQIQEKFQNIRTPYRLEQRD